MSLQDFTSETIASDRAAIAELDELLRGIDLAAPSSVKFDEVKRWLAGRIGLLPKDVAVYWVSKAGNFDVRFNQPGVQRDRPRIGVALIPGDHDFGAFKKRALHAVEVGSFQVMAICARHDDCWTGEASYVRRDSELDATVGGLIQQDRVALAGDPEEPESRRSHESEELKPSGLDPVGDMSVGWGEYPLDAVFVRSETRTVAEAVKRIRAGRYKLDPDFQRDFVWPVDKQSRLIESCTMRIPLPVLYLAEAKDGSIVVVDGLQRLTTFARFLDNEFALSGIDGGDQDEKRTHPLVGRKFNQLPLALAERIEDTQLTLYILDSKAPDRAKLDIFERVNSGVPLSRQQMRNCLFNGPATQWLKEAATTPVFLAATGQSLDSRTMRDREAINRFCAFHMLGWEGYRGDMDAFLARSLEAMNDSEPGTLDALKLAFDRAMTINHGLFGRHAFRKSLMAGDQDAPRTVINIALFDVCSTLLAMVPDRDLPPSDAEEVRRRMADLIGNDEFSNAVTYSTNSTRQVRSRFEMALRALEGLV